MFAHSEFLASNSARLSSLQRLPIVTAACVLTLALTASVYGAEQAASPPRQPDASVTAMPLETALVSLDGRSEALLDPTGLMSYEEARVSADFRPSGR